MRFSRYFIDCKIYFYAWYLRIIILGSRRPCKKAKMMRKEKRIERLRQKGLNPDEVKGKHVQVVKTLEQHLQEPIGAKHKLEVAKLK